MLTNRFIDKQLVDINTCIQLSDIKSSSSIVVRSSSLVAERHEQPTTNHQRSFKFSGDSIDRVTPVPIPNTEVKPVGADGTARVTVWESRKSPD